MKQLRYLLLVLLFGLSTVLYAENEQEWKEVAYYDNQLPEDVAVDLQYDEKQEEYLDYVFIASRVANVRELPSLEGKVIGKFSYNNKLPLLEKVKNKGNYWYKVRTPEGKVGYISSSVSRKRNFRVDMAMDKIHELERFLEKEKKAGRKLAAITSYRPNPNHENLEHVKDKYGMSSDQNAAGVNAKGETVFIPDRSVVAIYQREGQEAEVKALSIPEKLTISKKYLSYAHVPKPGFSRVIAIDTKNQNFTVFSKESGEWKLISYVYSKTGLDTDLGFATPKGFYGAAMAKYVMPYNGADGLLQGGAKYAIRFCGGAYIHGTPINTSEEVNREFFLRQKEFTLGTSSGTRKCIRTSEGHAKFLFDWVVRKPKKSSNLQHISDDLVVIVF